MTTNAIKPLPPYAYVYGMPSARYVMHPEYDALRSYTEDCRDLLTKSQEDLEQVRARLRVAVGALKGIANGANGDHDPVCEEDSLTYKEIEDFACKALATIGPLPEEKQGGEGKK